VSAGRTGQATGKDGDMPARDPAGAAALERRYLRLLRCYPPTHREFHREEMLGVLLATARPGQRTPGLGQTVNLAACGWLAADAGQDALAVVSLIAPAVVLILLALQQAAITAYAGARPPVGYPGLVPVLPSLAEPVVGLAWLAVVLLGLTGRQRKAAAIASIWLTLAVLILVILATAVMQPGPNVNVPMTLFQFAGMADVPVVLVSLAACSLVFSPGPRRGLAIVGWRRACLMIAGLSAGFGFPSIVQLADPAAPVGDLAFRLLGVLAIAVAVAVTCVRGPVGRRVAGLMATGLLPSLAVTMPLREFGLLVTLVSLLVAVLVWPAAIVSWRGRVRRPAIVSWRGRVRQAVLFVRSDRSYSRGATAPSSDRVHVRKL